MATAQTRISTTRPNVPAPTIPALPLKTAHVLSTALSRRTAHTILARMTATAGTGTAPISSPVLHPRCQRLLRPGPGHGPGPVRGRAGTQLGALIIRTRRAPTSTRTMATKRRSIRIRSGRTGCTIRFAGCPISASRRGSVPSEYIKGMFG